MHMHIDAMKVASNCRETASLFANYTSSKGGFNGNRGNPSGSATDFLSYMGWAIPLASWLASLQLPHLVHSTCLDAQTDELSSSSNMPVVS